MLPLLTILLQTLLPPTVTTTLLTKNDLPSLRSKFNGKLASVVSPYGIWAWNTPVNKHNDPNFTSSSSTEEEEDTEFIEPGEPFVILNVVDTFDHTKNVELKILTKDAFIGFIVINLNSPPNPNDPQLTIITSSSSSSNPA